jgi:hypothetical protein
MFCATIKVMSKVLMSVVGLVLGLMLIGNVLPDVIHDVATEDYAEPFSVSSGVTNTTQTLSYDHYYADLTSLSATSDDVADTPVVMSYAEATKEVVVTGLDAAESRILTISYVRESRQDFTGFSAFVRLLPFLLIVGLVMAALWGLFSAWKSRG